MNLRPLSACLALLLSSASASGHGLELIVNSAGNDNTPDARLTFVEALLIASDALGRPISAGESAFIIEDDSDELNIRFAIPGTGPHFIQAPPGGFPPLATHHFLRALIDGYSQPGARPNTHPITAANNAELKLVLDCRGLQPDPATGELPDWTLLIAAPNVHVRGFSVLADADPDNYGMYFTGGVSGGQVSGCWFGLSPDQTILSGGEVAIAAYETEGGHVFGTNGDGVDDRAEFNVIVAHAIGVQFEDTRDVKVSGNFIGVMPDGLSTPPAHVIEFLEGDAVEGAGLAGTIVIGTDGDGVADADERNIIGGMRDDVIELYGSAERFIVAGNYIGVGVDGTTPLPPINKFLRVQEGRFEIGAGPAEPVTAARANVIAGLTGYLLNYRAAGHFVSLRGNRVRGADETLESLFLNPSQSHHALRLGLDDALLEDITPVLATNAPAGRLHLTVPVSGPGTNGLAPAVVDLYLADVGPLPQGAVHLRTYVDNGPEDADPAPGRLDVPLPLLPGAGARLTATSTIRDDAGFETTPFATPVEVGGGVPPPPTLTITRDGSEVVLAWDDPAYGAQFLVGDLTDPAGWSDIPGESPRRAPLSLSDAAFFRLIRR